MIESFLYEIHKFIEKKKSLQQAAKEKGECFNIFKVLSLEANETKLHSALIAELLNPKGSHGLGSDPLRLFLFNIDKSIAQKFVYEKAKINVEYHLGKINDNYTSGGRVDILIEDGNFKIVIENKIYAEDQPNQLYRYKEKLTPTILLYLTLNGHEASSSSTNNGELKINVHYNSISYKEDIRQWLESCRNINHKNLNVNLIINQYIQTINNLTGQNMNEKDFEELTEIIQKHPDSADELINNYDNIKMFIINHQIKKLLEGIASENNLKVDFDDIRGCRNGLQIKNGNSGFDFYKEGSSKRIRFIFREPNLKGLSYGINDKLYKENRHNGLRLFDSWNKKLSPDWIFGRCDEDYSWDFKTLSEPMMIKNKINDTIKIIINTLNENNIDF